MMGTGTNGIAPLKLNRMYIGIDIDPQTFSDAQANIRKLMSEISFIPPNPK